MQLIIDAYGTITVHKDKDDKEPRTVVAFWHQLRDVLRSKGSNAVFSSIMNEAILGTPTEKQHVRGRSTYGSPWAIWEEPAYNKEGLLVSYSLGSLRLRSWGIERPALEVDMREHHRLGSVCPNPDCDNCPDPTTGKLFPMLDFRHETASHVVIQCRHCGLTVALKKPARGVSSDS